MTLCRFCPLVDRSEFAGFRFPPDVIALAVRWYLRDGLSYRDVDGYAPLSEQLFDIAVGQAIAQIPADGDRDHVGREPEPSKL